MLEYLQPGEWLIIAFTLAMMLAGFGLFILWYKADKLVQSLRRRIAELESAPSKPTSEPEQGRTMPYDTTADKV